MSGSEERINGFSVVKKEYELFWDFKNPFEDSNVKKTDDRDKKTNGRDPSKKRKRGMNKGRKAEEMGIRKTLPKSELLCTQVSQGVACDREDCKFSHDLVSFMKAREEDIGDDCPYMDKYGFCFYGYKCLYSKNHLKKVSDDNWELNYPLPGTEENNQSLQKFNQEISNTLSFDLMRTLRKKKYSFELHPDKIESKSTKKLDFANKIYIAPLTTVGNLPFRRIMKEFGADITCGEMAMARNLLDGKLSEWALVKKHSSEDFFGVQIADSDPTIVGKCAALLKNECNFDFLDINLGCPIDLVTNYGAGSALMNRDTKFKSMIEQILSRTKGTLPIGIKMRTGWNSNKPTAHKLCCKIESWKSRMEFGEALKYVSIHGRSRQQRYTKVSDWEYISKISGRVSGRCFLNSNPKTPLSLNHRSEPIKVFGNGDILSFIEWEQHLSRVDDWFQYLEELEAEDESRYLTQLKEAQATNKQAVTTEFKKLDLTSEDLDALKKTTKSQLTTCMLARGALIKPWLCQEIKEKRHIDISASERLDMIKSFTNYGLTHWGSDRKGVNNTRRFLLEWMSFLHRYVPVGILEESYVPQRINDRPPKFQGRSDLETLLGSHNVLDWIKVTEMFLGKVPEGFSFVPKHKANSFEAPTDEVVKKFKTEEK